VDRREPEPRSGLCGAIAGAGLVAGAFSRPAEPEAEVGGSVAVDVLTVPSLWHETFSLVTHELCRRSTVVARGLAP